jgi:cytoskeletal protein CcmA (bactofilin family)
MLSKNPNELDQSRGGGQATHTENSKSPIMPAGRDGIRPSSLRRAREFPGVGGEDRAVGNYGDSKKLIIGREIVLSGNITACEKLVVEGFVETDISACREIEISETGTFKGEAEIDVAEVSGVFEGNICAKTLLVVRSTGRVNGKIRVRQLEVERGGEVSGEVEIIPDAVDAG